MPSPVASLARPALAQTPSQNVSHHGRSVTARHTAHLTRPPVGAIRTPPDGDSSPNHADSAPVPLADGATVLRASAQSVTFFYN